MSTEIWVLLKFKWNILTMKTNSNAMKFSYIMRSVIKKSVCIISSRTGYTRGFLVSLFHNQLKNWVHKGVSGEPVSQWVKVKFIFTDNVPGYAYCVYLVSSICDVSILFRFMHIDWLVFNANFSKISAILWVCTSFYYNWM